MYTIQTGIPIPETRGRKKGSRARNHAAKLAAIEKGVAIKLSGAAIIFAARAVLHEYSNPKVSERHLARLIKNALRRYQ